MSLRNATSRNTVLLIRILVGVVFILLAFGLDSFVQDTVRLAPISQTSTAAPATLEKKLATGLSKYGDWPFLLAAGVIGLAALCLSRRYQASRILALVLLAGLLAGLSSTIIRSTVCRTRPLSHHPQGFYGPRLDSHWIIGKYEFGSFPSGHTATAMGLASAMWMFTRRWAVIIGTFAVAIAWSRIALGCHHFSDVVASTAWAFLITPPLVSLFDPWLSRHWHKWFGHWNKSDSAPPSAALSPAIMSPEKMG